MVDSPDDWMWSSHRAILGLEKPISCLEPDLVLENFGENDVSARKEYQKFVLAGIGIDEEKEMSKPIIGDEQFIEMHQKLIGSRVSEREHPIEQRFLSRPPLSEMFTNNGIRGKKNREVRNNNIFRAIEHYGYSQSEVADLLGLHYSGISKIVGNLKIQDSRRDPNSLP